MKYSDFSLIDRIKFNLLNERYAWVIAIQIAVVVAVVALLILFAMSLLRGKK